MDFTPKLNICLLSGIKTYVKGYPDKSNNMSDSLSELTSTRQ